MRWRLLRRLGLMTATLYLIACQRGLADLRNPPPVPSPDPKLGGTTITWYGGPLTESEQSILRRFSADSGIRIIHIPLPGPIPEDYARYQQILTLQRADVDVLSLDVIWTRSLAPHLIDLRPSLGMVANDHFPMMIQNNSVDGRLIGIPFYSNVTLLYYRTDLLKKYGFTAPPETWEQLETMAQTIQQGERPHNPAFAGFVWSGAADESLTHAAMEWQVSHGGGQILDPETGAVEVNNPRAIAAFARAASWIGTISPVSVKSFNGGESFEYFAGGNAAFCRDWIAFRYAEANASNSPIRGRFDVAILPHAKGPFRSASTRGEWQLGISAYSTKQAAATEFVRYMTSYEVQKWRALHSDQPPTIPSLYRSPELLRQKPYLRTVGEALENHAVARPSWHARENYSELSKLYSEGVGEILRGADPAYAVAQMEADLKALR